MAKRKERKALKLSCDSKVRFYKTQHNSLGLLPGPLSRGGTCPGCTMGNGGCFERSGKTRTCYAYKLVRAWTNVRNALTNNTRLINETSGKQLVDLLAGAFKQFAGRNPAPRNWFRLFWSGDIPNKKFARALRKAVDMTPEVNFWMYTRSFDCVKYLAGCPNLRVYLSLDQVNRQKGLITYVDIPVPKRKNISISYMGATNDLRLKPCPADEGKLKTVGACAKCGQCLRGSNVWFKTK